MRYRLSGIYYSMNLFLSGFMSIEYSLVVDSSSFITRSSVREELGAIYPLNRYPAVV